MSVAPLKAISVLAGLLLLTAGATAQQLTKYVDEQRIVSNIDVNATAQLRTELEQEVDRVVTPNLHLAPAWYQRGMGGNPRLHGNPAELVYGLLLARDHVKDELKLKIDTYVRREVRDWPLWQYYWVSQGARREHWPVPSDRIDSGEDTSSSKAAYINLYVLWAYAQKTGDTAFLNSNWSAITTLYNYIGTPTSYTYPQAMGIIGYARMAYLLNKSAEYNAARNKATQALSSVLGAGFVQMHAAADTAYAGTGHKWYFVPFHYRRDNTGNGRTGAFYCPELGRLLRELDKANVESDMATRVTSNSGGNARYSWWMYYGDQPWGYTAAGGENNLMGPDYSWAIFMLMADVLDATPQQLVGWLDVPFVDGDTYWILRQVRAIEAFGSETWQSPGGGTGTPPAAPTNLSAQPIASTQINLSWADNAVDEAGFKVERKTGASGTWAQVGTSGANINSFADTGLTPTTQYYYRVRAYNSAGDSAYTNEANATTLSGDTPALIVSNVSATSGRTYTVVNNGLQVGAAVYTDRTYSFTSVPAAHVGRTYIKTANEDKNSTASALLSFDVNQDVIVFVAHDDRVNAKPAWLSSFTLTSEDLILSGASEVLSIYSKSFPAGTITLGGNVVTTASSVTNYVVIIAPGGGSAAPAAQQLLSTSSSDPNPQLAEVPAAPSHLNAVALASGRIRLSWVDNAGAERKQQIQRKIGEAGTWRQVAEVDADVTVWRDAQVKAGVRYHYRVRACSPAGDSEWSESDWARLALKR